MGSGRHLTGVLLVGAGAFVLGSCAVPAAVSIASYSFDGFSYATSGKSVTDHMLSQVTAQNCGLLRVVIGDPICRDYTPEEQREMARQRDQELASNSDARAQRMGEPVGYVAMTGASDAAAAHAPPPVRTLAAWRLSEESLTELGPWDQVPTLDGKLASADGPSAAPKRGIPLAFAAASARGRAEAHSWVPLPPRKLAVASARGASGPSAEPPTEAGRGEASVYLVLASFANDANAAHALASFAASKPAVATTVVDGEPVHRIVVGPFRSEDAASVRRALERRHGVRGAWMLPGCDVGSGVECVASVGTLHGS